MATTLENAAGELHGQLAHLQEDLERLSARLAPLQRPEDAEGPSAQGLCPRPPLSAAVGSIVIATEKVLAARAFIERLQSKLEL